MLWLGMNDMHRISEEEMQMVDNRRLRRFDEPPLLQRSSAAEARLRPNPVRQKVGREGNRCLVWLLSMLIYFIFIFSPSTFVVAQETPFVGSTFVQPTKDIKLTPGQNDMLLAIKQLPTSQDVKVVRVNADALKNSDQMS